jgi:hypothetical protein
VPQDEQYTSSVHLKAPNFLYLAQLNEVARKEIVAPLQVLQKEETIKLKRFERLAERKEVVA